jgi:hypothetical protein
MDGWMEKASRRPLLYVIVGLVALDGKDIVFRFIIEYISLRDFYGPLGLQ